MTKSATEARRWLGTKYAASVRTGSTVCKRRRELEIHSTAASCRRSASSRTATRMPVSRRTADGSVAIARALAIGRLLHLPANDVLRGADTVAAETPDHPCLLQRLVRLAGLPA